MSKKVWMVRVAALGLLCLAVLSLVAVRWFLTSESISQGWELHKVAAIMGGRDAYSLSTRPEYKAWDVAIGKYAAWSLTIVAATVAAEALILILP